MLEWLGQPDCPAWCKSQAAVGAATDLPPPPHLDYPHVLQAVPAVLVNLCDASEVVAQAVAAAEMDLYCEAEQLFIRALTLEDSAATREMCAQVAMENDCPVAAVEHAAQAAKLQPTWPVAFITLGRACRNAGKLARASAAFTTALSLIPIHDVRNIAEMLWQTYASCLIHFRLWQLKCKWSTARCCSCCGSNAIQSRGRDKKSGICFMVALL